MYWHVGRERHLSIESHESTREALRAAIRYNLMARRLREPEDFIIQQSNSREPVVIEELTVNE